jgi:hypothetical protein
MLFGKTCLINSLTDKAAFSMPVLAVSANLYLRMKQRLELNNNTPVLLLEVKNIIALQ